MHIDDLIGYLTARRREYRAAVALIVVDPEQSRITAHDIIVKCLSLPRLVKAVAIRRQRLESINRVTRMRRYLTYTGPKQHHSRHRCTTDVLKDKDRTAVADVAPFFRQRSIEVFTP